ncbi:MAG: ABC transporter permease subunit [Alphaproteobacteria bacterium]|nr:ABC transporter permease subunit [Alphaproteobacteria bacterium]
MTTLRALLRDRAVDYAVLAVLVLAVWQIAHLWAGDMAMTSPWSTLRHTARPLASDEFWPHVQATMTAFIAALVLASSAGVVIGTILGYQRLAGDIAEPILVGIYLIPKVTLYPIILLFFGIGISAEIAFGALHGIIPIILFTMNAVRNIRRVLIKTAQVMRLAPLALLRTILIPAALPEVFAGLRVGFSLTLIGTLLSEMFGSRRGLGYVLMNAIGLHNMNDIMALTLILVGVAGAANAGLLMLDHRLHHRTPRS